MNEAINAEVLSSTLQLLAQRYAERFAKWGATPEQAEATLAQNWDKVMDDAQRVYSAAMSEMGRA